MPKGQTAVIQTLTFGYRVHGTIGILLRAIRRKQRTKEEVILFFFKVFSHFVGFR
jgi:hypothetical protein